MAISLNTPRLAMDGTSRCSEHYACIVDIASASPVTSRRVQFSLKFLATLPNELLRLRVRLNLTLDFIKKFSKFCTAEVPYG